MNLVRTESRGEVVLVMLNRPNKRNALTPELFTDLQDAIASVATSGGALVLGGEGPVFCGGFDLQLCFDRPGTMRELLTALADTITLLRSLDTPVVISAHGAAIAGGCALLGGGDVCITDAAAKLGYPVVRLGISPAVSFPFLRQSVGDGPARARMLDSGLIRGDQAVHLGLVHEYVPAPADVLPRAIEIALLLASKPKKAFAATKKWLRQIAPAQAEPGLRVSLGLTGGPEEAAALAGLYGPRP